MLQGRSYKGYHGANHIKLYSQLSATLYKLSNVSSSKFNIIMRVKYKLDCECTSVCLMDDSDIRFLLLEMDCKRSPIFIGFEETNQE